MYEKIVIVTRKTRLDELIARFNSRGQAKFYIEHSGGDFTEYQQEDDEYRRSLELLKHHLDTDLKVQIIDREFVPNFIFDKTDIIVVLGQDGLVANTAKYVGDQPIIGVNPDPKRIDGILVPVLVPTVKRHVDLVVENRAHYSSVTLAEAILNDGQRLLAFNDLFIGARSHVSARYSLSYGNDCEQQSSSGIIVATGAGSTGWLSSIFNMVNSVSQFMGGEQIGSFRLNPEDPSLFFVVREPFISKHSSAKVVAGRLGELVIESRMPQGGTIFSDGVEADSIAFDAGLIARIHPAKQHARLVQNDVAVNGLQRKALVRA